MNIEIEPWKSEPQFIGSVQHGEVRTAVCQYASGPASENPDDPPGCDLVTMFVEARTYARGVSLKIYANLDPGTPGQDGFHVLGFDHRYDKNGGAKLTFSILLADWPTADELTRIATWMAKAALESRTPEQPNPYAEEAPHVHDFTDGESLYQCGCGEWSPE